MPNGLYFRTRDYVRRRVSRWAARRTTEIRCDGPIISFSFDDFPSSALVEGGRILLQYGWKGTYYASLGLRGKCTPVGVCFDDRDLGQLVEDGHELGCHTYSHCHAWNTHEARFQLELEQNNTALRELFPRLSMRTMSYPISCPRPANKQLAGREYACCRGGGQTFNVGTVDANYVQAFFLEKCQNRLEQVRQIVEANSYANGWLIFATHDIAVNPTPFGCTPTFFAEVVALASTSGARILPVAEAWDEIARPQQDAP